jgi:hypothetical protein
MVSYYRGINNQAGAFIGALGIDYFVGGRSMAVFPPLTVILRLGHSSALWLPHLLLTTI